MKITALGRKEICGRLVQVGLVLERQSEIRMRPGLTATFKAFSS